MSDIRIVYLHKFQETLEVNHRTACVLFHFLHVAQCLWNELRVCYQETREQLVKHLTAAVIPLRKTKRFPTQPKLNKASIERERDQARAIVHFSLDLQVAAPSTMYSITLHLQTTVVVIPKGCYDNQCIHGGLKGLTLTLDNTASGRRHFSDITAPSAAASSTTLRTTCEF